MSYKTKSLLYFASFIIAVLSYYNTTNTNLTVATGEIANAEIENVSTLKNLN